MSAKIKHSEKEALKNTKLVILVNFLDENNNRAFFYISINADKYLNFKNDIKNDSFQPVKYGEIIIAGYGEPSDSLKQELKEKYGCNEDDYINI